MKHGLSNFKEYLIDTYEELPKDIVILDDGEYHILKNNKNRSFILYIFCEYDNEYSYVELADIEWETIAKYKSGYTS